MWCHFMKSKNKEATKFDNRRKDGDKCEGVAHQRWCYIDNQHEQLVMKQYQPFRNFQTWQIWIHDEP